MTSNGGGERKSSLLPSTCGMSTSLDRVIGGEDAPIASYTWMAALGYIGKFSLIFIQIILIS